MTEEQRQAALGAMKMLEIIIIDLTNDLIKNKNPSFSEQTVEMMVDSFKQVRAALQSATISETQLESEIKKTAMSEKKATPVPSNINDNITITMDSKGRMIMKLKPCYELGKDITMTNLDQLKQEVSDITHELDRKVAMQVIDYLSENGYLRDEWRPIETAPKTGEKILVYRPVHDGDYIPVTGEDYWGSNIFNPEGCWMRSRQDCPPTHWMPLPKQQKGE